MALGVDKLVPEVNFDWLGALPARSREYQTDLSIRQALQGSDINTASSESLEKIAATLMRTGHPKALELGVRVGEVAQKRRESELAERGLRFGAGILGGGATASGAPMVGERPGQPSPELAGIIKRESERTGVPENELTRLLWTESRFNPMAISPTGAKGIAQSTTAARTDFGVSDPYNVPEAVRGAADQYKTYLSRYGGNVGLAHAAYNWGPGNIDKVLKGQIEVRPETRAHVIKTTGRPIEDWVEQHKSPLAGALYRAEQVGARHKAETEAVPEQARRMLGAAGVVGGTGLKGKEMAESLQIVGKSAIEAKQKETEAQSKRFGEAETEIFKKRAAASQTLNTLDLIEKLVNDPKTVQGTGAETYARLGSLVGTVKQIGEQFGVDFTGDLQTIRNLKDSVSRTQALSSLSNKLVLTMLGGSLGNQISNADRDFIRAINPAIVNSPDANRILIGALRGMATRDKEVAQITQRYAKAGGRSPADLDEQIASYGEANPIFKRSDGQLTELGKSVLSVGGGGDAPAPGAPVTAPPQALPAPTQAHIQALRANPNMARDFDAKFGPGSAQRVLGGI